MISAVRRRLKSHPWISVLGVAVIIVIFVGGYAALMSYVQAQDALRNVDYVEHHLTMATSQVGRDDLAHHLAMAEQQLEHAEGSFNTLGVLPVAQYIPYVGADISGTKDLLIDAHRAAATGVGLLTAVSQVAANGPGETLTASHLDDLHQKVSVAITTLASLRRPTGSLFGPVGHNREVFNAKVEKIVRSLVRVNDGIVLAKSVFATPASKVLVLPENNAEMRDQGAILSYALLSVQGTKVVETSSGEATSVVAPHPVPVPVSAGTRAFFYGNGANQDLRFVNATADFSWTGGTAASIFQAATGTRVNTVVAVDVPTMASLLKVTGPLYVPSAHVVLNAGNFSTYVLHDLYLHYPVGSQGPRKAELSEIASLLLQRIKGSTHNQFEFLRSLASDIPGRHLLVWSRDPSVESAINDLGASGTIANIDPASTFHLAVESAVAAKLDYFVHVSQSIHVTVHQDGSASVTTEVTETNTAPRGQKPSYALGPDGLNAKVPGEYVSNTYLWSPASSVVAGGRVESGLVLTGTSVVVMPQTSSRAYFSTFLPHAVRGGRFTLRLVPQGRLDPIQTKVIVFYQGKYLSSGGSSSLRLSTPVTMTYSLVP